MTTPPPPRSRPARSVDRDHGCPARQPALPYRFDDRPCAGPGDRDPLSAATDPDPRGLTAQERALLKLLAQGLTGEAAATRRGVFHRSARRIMADLMERLEARSRFEAGLKAVQRGRLGQPAPQPGEARRPAPQQPLTPVAPP